MNVICENFRVSTSGTSSASEGKEMLHFTLLSSFIAPSSSEWPLCMACALKTPMRRRSSAKRTLLLQIASIGANPFCAPTRPHSVLVRDHLYRREREVSLSRALLPGNAFRELCCFPAFSTVSFPLYDYRRQCQRFYHFNYIIQNYFHAADIRERGPSSSAAASR